MKKIIEGRPHLIWFIPKIVFVFIVAATAMYSFFILTGQMKYIASGILVLSGVLGLFWTLHYLSLYYEITEDRITIKKGIFSVQTKFIELYRVKDVEMLEPFIYRFFGLAHIHIYSSDVDLPEFTFLAQNKKKEPIIRNAVESIRKKKGVREIDTV